MDGQTDGQNYDSQDRASIARAVKKHAIHTICTNSYHLSTKCLQDMHAQRSKKFASIKKVIHVQNTAYSSCHKAFIRN